MEAKRQVALKRVEPPALFEAHAPRSVRHLRARAIHLDSADAAAVFSAVGDAAYVWDLTSDELFWSENAAEVLGLNSGAVLSTGAEFAAFLDPENSESRFDEIMSSHMPDEGAGVPYEIRYHVRQPAGETRAIEDCGRWFAGHEGKPVRAVGVVRALSSRHRLERDLVELATVDPLTGRMNRMRLCQEIDGALARSLNKGTNFGFLLLGIDGLGRLNRNFGFNVADQAIAAVAQRLGARARGSDALGRFSNSKFGIVLNDCNVDDMAIAAARFVNAVRDLPVETSAGPVAVSVTAGGVIAPRHAGSMPEIMGFAQEALDAAREAERGSFRAYVPNAESEARRRENLRLADVIVAAVHDRRLRIAFQPIVRAKGRSLAFRECLVRICEPDGHEIDAKSIMTVAEKLDLVRLIDHRVLELAAAELRVDPLLCLSLNVSASTVHDPVWLAAFAAEMRDGLAERLIVELTESVAIHDVNSTRRFVTRVKEAGCRVAIDDFGAGYTSFRNLRRLGVHMVKIDGSFIANLERAPDDRVFVRTLLNLARELDLETVAEWVQTEAAAALLTEWGCDYLQGALVGLAAPRPALDQIGEAELWDRGSDRF